MKRSEKVGFTIIAFSFIFKVITLPISPGTFYEPSHYYNLYLSNFGFGSEISILPTAFKTLITEYSFFKVLLEFFQGDALALHRFLYILSPILIFLAFILFFGTIHTFRKKRILLSSLLALIVNWPSIPLILGMTALFCIIKSMSKKNSAFFKIMLILSFTSLALYWHSAHMLFFTTCISFLIFSMIFNKKEYLFQKKLRETLSIFSIIFIISIVAWVLIRETPLFSLAFKITYYLDPSVIVSALFSKGSFLPVDYQYVFDFYIPAVYLDIMRYVTYFITFFGILLYILHNIHVKKNTKKLILALSSFSGTIGFIFAYFIATETIGPAPILIFLIPFFLMLCFNFIKSCSPRSKLGWGLLFVLIMSSQIIMVSYNTYENVTTSTEFSIDFERYSSPSLWLAKYLPTETIISDANTMGYLAIQHAQNNQHENSTMYFSNIGLAIYDQLYKGTYQGDSKVIYNFDMYKKNLVFESLQAWNKFKPLPPDIIQKNKFSILYCDAGIFVLSK